MPYRYATTRDDYNDYASGRVFYALTGRPAFPIRLASEMFSRCLAVHHAAGRAGPYVLYDPLCGGGYLLSTLAYLHWPDIAQIIGSDVDQRALATAERNLGLLTVEGIERRRAEIVEMIAKYGKPSHQAALESAERLQKQLSDLLFSHVIPARVFQADAMDGQALARGLGGTAIDIVIADVPYGRDSAWQLAAPAAAPPLWQMLDALSAVPPTSTVVALSADKAQQIAHPAYRRIERFRLGKRQVALLQLADSGDRTRGES